MIPVLTVTAGILRNRQQVLAAKRMPGDSLGGMWEFPGGKTEPGERTEPCLIRELREELGIEVLECSAFDESYFEYGLKRVHLFAFLINRYTGTPSPLAHEKIRWIDIDDLGNYSFAPADVPFVWKLKSRFGGQRLY